MASGDLQFRIATPDDAAQIQQLLNSAFRAEDSRENWTGDMGLASEFNIAVEEIMRNITAPDSAYLMATDERGVLTGSVGVSKRGADVGRIYMLAVDPHRHRGGIGRKVLAFAEEYSRQRWGVGKMSLNALSTRLPLLEWYLRCGYRKTGELTPVPREWFKDRILPDDFCFVEFEKDLVTDPSAAGAADTA
ncbi:acyl-CoA N-acyltransferase [Daldinia caldariorum]|uniref:acyl-CoA N-acyltransferase n=1 Tax=Daldinia caldariorum TaxID=326644 RepID=UPI00200821B1|nr:acyl-CoA N-acyltransferase [Daldinia caldariorum]KAI1465576.1 acyl-CoA N-acyltransferase [Daldinia caldariorum]